MAEGGPPPPDAGTRGDAIGPRLAPAFAAVALAALALLARLTAPVAAAGAPRLAPPQPPALTRAVPRRITGPVGERIGVTRAMGRGDRTARVGRIPAPGELRELATAFNQMANTLDRQEQLRRALVADVAHELRTPIAVLQAGHEALLDGGAEPPPSPLASLRDEGPRPAPIGGDPPTAPAPPAAPP